MLRINNILVPTDFSVSAEAAIMHALHLARAHGAALHLLHVVEGGIGYDHDRFFPELSPRHARMISRQALMDHETLVTSQHWNGVPLRRVTRYSMEAAPIILDYLHEHDIDLVVMGTHGHRSMNRFLAGGGEGWIMGDTTERVLRMAGCPVFTIGPRHSRPDLVRTILVPLDFSSHTRETLRYARELALRYEARLDLFHVIEAPAVGGDGYALLATEKPAIRRAYALAELKVLYETTEGPDVPVSFHVAEGQPSDEILAYVRTNNVQMVVLSSHGKHNPMQMHVGTEAHRVVRAAPCPVFTVKTFGLSLLDDAAEAENAQS